MCKAIGSYLLASAVVLGAVDTAYAQRQSPAFGVSSVTPPQTINITFGGFLPLSEGKRTEGDVLCYEIDGFFAGNCSFLDFDFNKFKSVTLGGEYLLPIGQNFEMSAGVSFSLPPTSTVPSRYTDLVADDPTTPIVEEEDIRQDLSLRLIPMSFTARWLPFGQSKSFQPYVGAGIGLVSWKYTESGEFVDLNANVFRDTFEDSGTKVGPVILAGARFAIESFVIGGEFRWQHAQADLDPNKFDYDPTLVSGPRLDLGGWTYQATFGVRFD